MPYENEHAARLQDPSNFKFYRRTDGGTIFGKVKVPSTISIIWGKQTDSNDDPNDPPIVQALRFDKDSWTEKQAKDWIAKNKIKSILFEPAKEEKSNFAELEGSHEELRRLLDNAVREQVKLFGGVLDKNLEYIYVYAIFDDYAIVERSGIGDPSYYQVDYVVKEIDDEKQVEFFNVKEVEIEVEVKDIEENDHEEEDSETQEFADDSLEKKVKNNKQIIEINF